jgi:hypothetical protein
MSDYPGEIRADDLRRRRYGRVGSDDARYIQSCPNSRGEALARTVRTAFAIRGTRRCGELVPHPADAETLARYCSMYNNLGAAGRRTSFVRTPSSAPSAGNLIPRGDGGRARPGGEGRIAGRAGFSRGIALRRVAAELAASAGNRSRQGAARGGRGEGVYVGR